jgi:hypothetical protein
MGPREAAAGLAERLLQRQSTRHRQLRSSSRFAARWLRAGTASLTLRKRESNR